METQIPQSSHQDVNTLKFKLNLDKIQIINSEESIDLTETHTYFNLIFNELSNMSESKASRITQHTFLKYYELPGLIGERIFKVLDKDKDELLSRKEFVRGMMKFYDSNFEKKMKMVFKIYDFKERGFFTKDEAILLLSHVPLKRLEREINSIHFSQSYDEYTCREGSCLNFTDRIKSKEQIEELAHLIFDKIPYIDFKDFKKICQDVNSELFLCIYLLMRSIFPSAKDFSYVGNKGGLTTPSKALQKDSPIMASPKVLSSFSPMSQLIVTSSKYENEDFGSYLSKFNKNEKNKDETKEEDDKEEKEDGEDTVRRPNRLVKAPYESLTLDQNTELSVSPSEFLSSNSINTDITIDFEDSLKNITNSGYLYSKNESGVLKRFWCKQNNKELYWYESKESETHFEMMSLVKKFIKTLPKLPLKGGYSIFPFSIFSNKKDSILIYAVSKEERQNWVNSFRHAIGYLKFNSFYSLDKIIGQGSFGVVYLAIHKETNQKVAVKIIKKNKMNEEQLTRILKEIEILKLCQHPNLVRLLDLFESHHKYFIVLEYLEGGDLFNYLEKRKFRIPEIHARKIIHSLATGLFYLHSYGIVHRDMKPENILLTSNSEQFPDVKIADFGISEMIGPGEKCVKPFGTMAYCAPEVLLGKEYDKSIDLWSLGVILYLLLFGFLPFQQKSEKEIANEIINNTPYFPSITNVSKDGCILIKRLLQKESPNRINLTDLLLHPWINAENLLLQNLRIQATNDSNRRNSFLLFSTVKQITLSRKQSLS